MGTFAPQSVYSNNPSPQTGAGLAALASNQEAIMELPGAQAPQSVEISDDALTFSTTPVSAYLIVDTEGQAAADDLEVINPVVSATDNLHDGMIVNLQATDAARVVTVVNSNAANGIKTVSGGNITLTTSTWCALQLRSGTWYEIASSQPQTIDGVTFNGTAGISHAAVCSTAAATAAKTVALTGFVLAAGAEITVKFTNGNTASNPTLNVNSTSAVPIVYQGVAIDDTVIGANTVCRMYYDGTSWNVVGVVTSPATTSSLGIARLATQAEVQAGAASASPLPAVLDVNDIGKIPAALGGTMMYNTRTVLTTSGTWTAPITGWYKVTAIGGGGAGGKGGNVLVGGLGGGQGGTTSFGSLVSATGGSGGGGGSGYGKYSGGGGGGGAGEVAISYNYIASGQTITVTIGAGANSQTGDNADSFGGSGVGSAAGKGGKYYQGGSGAAGASTGSPSVASGYSGTGGAGGRNGTGYGGGGGGGGGCYGATVAANGVGGSAADGASFGGDATTSASGNGGAGGPGAIILEYFNPAVTA